MISTRFSPENSIALRASRYKGNVNKKTIQSGTFLKSASVYFEGLKNYNVAMLSFKGNVFVEDTELGKVFTRQYGGKPDQVAAFVLKAKSTPEQVKQFLNAVFNNPAYADMFFEAMTSEPKKSRDLSVKLIEKLGGPKPFRDFYFKKNGYCEAYAKHVERFYEKAGSLDDLIKKSPNWTIWSLKAKSESLSGNKHFTLGAIPEAVGGKIEFEELVSKLRQYPSGNIDVNGRQFFVKPLQNGLSDKTNFMVTAGNKKFVVKVGPVMDDEFHRDNADMKSDSCFITAQIDYYLALHNCAQSAKLHYYDYTQNTSIYECVEGTQKDDSVPLLTMNSKIQDVNALGLFINDSFLSNFIEREGNPVLIDSGESSFIDVLRPGCVGYHFDLPNLSGRSILSGMAGIALATGMLD